MLEGLGVEVRIEFPVHHVEHVPVELRRHARAVVVGTHQPVGVLDQVRTQQQCVAGRERVGEGTEELRSRPRREVADGGSEEDHQASAARRDLAEVFFEVATDGIDFDAGILGADRGALRR